MVTVEINNKKVQCLTDTGADINVIDHDWFHAKCPS